MEHLLLLTFAHALRGIPLGNPQSAWDKGTEEQTIQASEIA